MIDNSSDGSHFVEVGSWKGRSAAFMAVEIHNSGKGIKFDCIDTWEGSEEHLDLSSQWFNSELIKNKDWLYSEFLKNIGPVKDLINPIRKTSLEAASMYEDESLDFVFIDAAHDYENVKQDILAWLPKVKKGGVIAGHDYSSFPGVRQAVDEIFNHKIVSETCWIYKNHPPRNLFCFWFGPNMGRNRSNCLRSILKNCGVKVNVIGQHNVNDWVVPGYPLHSHFRHLSATHKADYLRSYFMYHYGGGYTDIKKCNYDWNIYFDILDKSNAEYMGYKERSPDDIAFVPNKHLYESMIGCCQFIFKPKSKLAEEWITTADEILNSVSNKLEKSPATDDFPQAVYGTIINNKGLIYEDYPLEWATICGSIFHKIQPKFFDRMLKDMPYVDTSEYR